MLINNNTPGPVASFRRTCICPLDNCPSLCYHNATKMDNHEWAYGHSMDYHVITSSFVCQPLLDFLKQNSAGIFTVRHKRKWLTNSLPCIIIIRHLRECWNGRQARLRCVWLRRVGSSPISRTKKEVIRKDDLFFGMWDGTRKADLKTVRWTVFPPWESPSKFGCIRYGCRRILNLHDVENTMFFDSHISDPTITKTPNPFRMK